VFSYSATYQKSQSAEFTVREKLPKLRNISKRQSSLQIQQIHT